MLFNSFSFLFIYFPFVITIYLLLNGSKLQKPFLISSSLLFYAWGDIRHIILLIILSLINYYIGNYLLKKHNKLVFILLIIFDLLPLFFYKYFNFFMANLSLLLKISFNNISLSLPLGISFYTFEILSYIIDIYTNRISKTSIYDFLCYITFFPKIISGPLIKYNDFIQKQDHSLDFDKIAAGSRRFIIGLAKKVIIADNLGIMTNTIFNLESTSLNHSSAIFGMIVYSIQLYIDFSSYSDMAIGISKILGFDFLENFNYPYFSKTISEFWRRWHISLGSWFRDYIYIPLGGNRKGINKQILNLIIVWFITGLWHGANYNFIIWGFIHCLFIIIEKLFLAKFLNKTKIISRLYVIAITFIAWTIFNCKDMSQVNIFISEIFKFESLDFSFINTFGFLKLLPYLFISLLFLFPLPRLLNDLLDRYKYAILIKNILCIIIFGISLVYLLTNTFNAFIYFQF